ncbi:hypothetical protein [uncultured Sulfitobacter sp.]|uniref:hypothetical protein n=1 Tax=uncultured Sulfitobacter sp. TaxID=191468 RepID=UPI00262AEA4A|nr:hypothetical protein [uncultured Sulfitobacter sp.]
MARQTPSQGPSKSGQNREDRLKSALKANMARRKAQARARAGQNIELASDTQADETDRAGKRPAQES